MGRHKASKTIDSVLKSTENLTELRALATKLQKQYGNVNKLMSQLNDSTENKKCENYLPVPVRCVNTTGGLSKNSFTKQKRSTAKRRERKNTSSTNKVSYKNDTGQKYIKNT